MTWPTALSYIGPGDLIKSVDIKALDYAVNSPLSLDPGHLHSESVSITPVETADVGWVIPDDPPSMANLAAADAVAYASGKAIILTPGAWEITDDLAITSPIKVMAGADIQIATTKTLTINGALDAGLYQIFSCTGTGKVVAAQDINAEWFGLSTSAIAAANDAAISNAISCAMASGVGVIVGAGAFDVSTTINLQNVKKFTGASKDSTIFNSSVSTGIPLVLYANHTGAAVIGGEVCHFAIIGSATTAVASQHGLQIGDATCNALTGVNFHDIYIGNTGGDGVYLYKSNYGHRFERLFTRYTYGDWAYNVANGGTGYLNNANVFYGCTAQEYTGGLHIDQSFINIWDSGWIESSAVAGWGLGRAVDINATTGTAVRCSVINSYIETVYCTALEAVYVKNSSTAEISGNIITTSSSPGPTANIRIASGSGNPRIVNNSLLTAATRASAIDCATSGGTVEGNYGSGSPFTAFITGAGLNKQSYNNGSVYGVNQYIYGTGANITCRVAEADTNPSIKLQSDYSGQGGGIILSAPGVTPDVKLYRGATNSLALAAGNFLTTDRIQMRILTAEPASPANGDICYADGTSWNPGAGAGPYVRTAGSWVKLF